MEAELEEIVKSQTTTFATFFGRKTLLPLGVLLAEMLAAGKAETSGEIPTEKRAP